MCWAEVGWHAGMDLGLAGCVTWVRRGGMHMDIINNNTMPLCWDVVHMFRVLHKLLEGQCC